ncbi:MAG: response regulator [Microthrixaceae bacterium]
MGPVRVLLVDDSEDMRLLCRIVLDKDPAFEVWGEAINGEEAIAAIADEAPDVIVLDVMMPVMDGLTALPVLRERCPWVPVVLLTASASDETRAHALELGAWAVLDKQIGLDEMTAALLAAYASVEHADHQRRVS